MTETQQKWHTVSYSEDTEEINNMRTLSDRKKGGLTVLKRGREILIKKRETQNSDLKVECEVHSIRLLLLVVYLCQSLCE